METNVRTRRWVVKAMSWQLPGKCLDNCKYIRSTLETLLRNLCPQSENKDFLLFFSSLLFYMTQLILDPSRTDFFVDRVR